MGEIDAFRRQIIDLQNEVRKLSDLIGSVAAATRIGAIGQEDHPPIDKRLAIASRIRLVAAGQALGARISRDDDRSR